eukprot:103004-Prymnesium_polylepis.1
MLEHKESMNRTFLEHEVSMVELMSSSVIDSLVREGKTELATELVMLQMRPYHTLAPSGSLPPLKSIERVMRCFFEATTPAAVAAHKAAKATEEVEAVFNNHALMQRHIFPAVLG